MAGRAGYFALVAARADGLADTSFNLGGADPVGYGLPIVLQPIPVPGVTGAVSPQAGTVEITVMLGDSMAGVYEAESGAGCSCGPIEYSVYRQIVTTGADWVPPDDRDPAAWTLATLAGAGAQTPSALGQPVTLSIDCTITCTWRRGCTSTADLQARGSRRTAFRWPVTAPCRSIRSRSGAGCRIRVAAARSSPHPRCRQEAA
jgi:hypothetical protein